MDLRGETRLRRERELHLGQLSQLSQHPLCRMEREEMNQYRIDYTDGDADTFTASHHEIEDGIMTCRNVNGEGEDIMVILRNAFTVRVRYGYEEDGL